MTGAPFACDLRVRYAESDPQGVVFNAHFLAYFDIAWTELLRAAFGGYQVLVERGVDVVVAEAGLRYRRPAHFDDDLTLEVAVTRLGTTSLTTRFRVLRDGELLVDGTLRHVVVELQRLLAREADAKTAIPDWMLEGLALGAEQRQHDLLRSSLDQAGDLLAVSAQEGAGPGEHLDVTARRAVPDVGVLGDQP